MAASDKGIDGLRKFHATGTDDYGIVQELQARAQERRALAVDDVFGVQVMDAFDVYAGVTGILYHLKSGEIKKITFTSIPQLHPKYGWCVALEGCGRVTVASLGILMSKDINPEQQVAVVKDDDENILRLAEQLERAGHRSVGQLKVLYPELLNG